MLNLFLRVLLRARGRNTVRDVGGCMSRHGPGLQNQPLYQKFPRLLVSEQCSECTGVRSNAQDCESSFVQDLCRLQLHC